MGSICPAIILPYVYNCNLPFATPLIPQRPSLPSGISQYRAQAVHFILPFDSFMNNSASFPKLWLFNCNNIICTFQHYKSVICKRVLSFPISVIKFFAGDISISGGITLFTGQNSGFSNVVENTSEPTPNDGKWFTRATGNDITIISSSRCFDNS